MPRPGMPDVRREAGEYMTDQLKFKDETIEQYARRERFESDQYKRFNWNLKDPFDGKRGENGERLCAWCGEPLSGRKIRWCGKSECIESFRIAKGDMSIISPLIWKRDKGICQICGRDIGLIKEVWSVLSGQVYSVEINVHTEVNFRLQDWSLGYKEIIELFKATGFQRGGQSQFWDCDHIVPVCEGGGCKGLENYRLLCVSCHKGETRKLHHVIATNRKRNEGAT